METLQLHQFQLAFDEATKASIFKQGELGLFVAFGAGLTWSAVLVRF